MDNQVSFMANELVQLSRDVQTIIKVLTAVLPLTADIAQTSDGERVQSSGGSDAGSFVVSATAAAAHNQLHHTTPASGSIKADSHTTSHRRRDAELPPKIRLSTGHRVNFCQNIQSAPSSAGLPPLIENLSSRSQSCDNVPIVDAINRLQGGSSAASEKPITYGTNSREGGNHRQIEGLDTSSGPGLVEEPDRRQRESEEQTDLSYAISQCHWSKARLIGGKSGTCSDASAKYFIPGDSGIEIERDSDHYSRSTLLTTDL